MNMITNPGCKMIRPIQVILNYHVAEKAYFGCIHCRKNNQPFPSNVPDFPLLHSTLVHLFHFQFIPRHVRICRLRPNPTAYPQTKNKWMNKPFPQTMVRRLNPGVMVSSVLPQTCVEGPVCVRLSVLTSITSG